jgi:hypothetical protein
MARFHMRKSIDDYLFRVRGRMSFIANRSEIDECNETTAGRA